VTVSRQCTTTDTVPSLRAFVPSPTVRAFAGAALFCSSAPPFHMQSSLLVDRYNPRHPSTSDRRRFHVQTSKYAHNRHHTLPSLSRLAETHPSKQAFTQLAFSKPHIGQSAAVWSP